MDRHSYFKLFHDISTADYALLAENLKLRAFKKGDVIISPGQIQRELYFVKTGVQMFPRNILSPASRIANWNT